MRKSDFCLCENKGADQLRSDCEAESTFVFATQIEKIPLLPKFEISSFYPSSVAAKAGLCQTWSEILMTGFLMVRLKCINGIICVNISCISM